MPLYQCRACKGSLNSQSTNWSSLYWECNLLQDLSIWISTDLSQTSSCYNALHVDLSCSAVFTMRLLFLGTVNCTSCIMCCKCIDRWLVKLQHCVRYLANVVALARRLMYHGGLWKGRKITLVRATRYSELVDTVSTSSRYPKPGSTSLWLKLHSWRRDHIAPIHALIVLKYFVCMLGISRLLAKYGRIKYEWLVVLQLLAEQISATVPVIGGNSQPAPLLLWFPKPVRTAVLPGEVKHWESGAQHLCPFAGCQEKGK